MNTLESVSLEAFKADIEARLSLLEAREIDRRRLPVAAAAKEFGFSLAEMEALIEADAVVLCNATTRPRVAMAETDRLLREKFHLVPRSKERKAA